MAMIEGGTSAEMNTNRIGDTESGNKRGMMALKSMANSVNDAMAMLGSAHRPTD